MKAQTRFRLSNWAAGSLAGLVAINLFLILFVAGVDIFLGQPPQLAVPLFALLIASSSLAFSRRHRVEAEGYSAVEVGNTETRASTWFKQRQSNAPAYVAMTIIRRPPVFAPSESEENWKGVVQ